MLIERDEAMADLAPLLAGLVEVFHEALLRTRKAPPLDMIDRTKTSNANLTRDYAVGGLSRLWAKIPDVHLCEANQQTLFVYRQKYGIRVKKFDRASCSQNYATPSDQNFRSQGQVEGLPLLSNMEVGYVLNSEFTEIIDVRIVCLNGDRPYWWESVQNPSNNLYDLFAGQRGPTPPAPTPQPKAPGETETGVSIKPKNR